MEQLSKNEFLKHVENHTLEILKDDGLYRHLICSNSGHWNQRFIIHTFPQGLLITGDMGSYEFERCDDMFAFFRSGITNGDINISTGYWAEKCKAESVFGDGIRKFSPDCFRDNVKEHFNEYFEENTDEAKEVWGEIEEQILSCEDNEYELVSALNNFSMYKTETRFSFADFWECSCDEKTYNFIWCLYAIVWAIREYDKLKGLNK